MCPGGLSILSVNNNPAFLRRGIMLALLAVSLSSCGFSSLYQEQHAVQTKLEEIFIIPPQTPAERQLYDMLLQQMGGAGRFSDAPMKLELALTTRSSDLLSRPNADIIRRNLLLRAPIRLLSGEAILMAAQPEVSVGYSRTDSGYANIRAQEKARQQGLQALARQIYLRLSAFLSGRENDSPPLGAP